MHVCLRSRFAAKRYTLIECIVYVLAGCLANGCSLEWLDISIVSALTIAIDTLTCQIVEIIVCSQLTELTV